MTVSSPTPSRTAAELVAEHAETLAAAGVPSPHVDARQLVDHVVGDDPAPGSERLALLAALVARRAARVPLQLLVGATWFRHLRLACRPGVFIPRPETEIVAGLAIDAARAAGDRPVVVEPCTGTGAIALSVVAEVAGAQVRAGDRSTAAVALARDNLATVEQGHAGVAGAAAGTTCRIAVGDLLDAVPADLRGHVDVLVCNPPYLPAGDRDSWQPEVAEHDPDDALVGGADGHEVVDALLSAATTWLRPGGTVVIEIDERRGADAEQVAHTVGLVDVRLEHDLTGAHRAIVARRPHAAGGTR